MRIKLYDCYEGAERLDVGDEFHNAAHDCSSDILNLEKIDIKLDGFRLKGYRKSDSYRELSWNLTCQSVFIIVDLSTNKVIYTSKKYSRLKRQSTSCEFYKELQDFIDSGFTVDKGLYKIEDDVFEDI